MIWERKILRQAFLSDSPESPLPSVGLDKPAHPAAPLEAHSVPVRWDQALEHWPELSPECPRPLSPSLVRTDATSGPQRRAFALSLPVVGWWKSSSTSC